MDRTLTTKAGFQALAGAARPGVTCQSASGGMGAHQMSTWATGATYVKPNTFEVIALTNRSARRPPELSP